MSTTTLNQENIIKKVYDPATETLKVNAIATISPGIVEITISDTNDSIKIGDGTGDFLAINPDGSINVNVTQSSGTVKNEYDEVTGVASGVTTVILNYIAPSITKLISCDFSGTNIAMYSLYINGILSAKKYTYWCNFNERFDFDGGLVLDPGDIVSIEVLHMRPDVGDFNSNIVVEN